MKPGPSTFSSLQPEKALVSLAPISICFSLLFFIARNNNFIGFIHLLSDAQSTSGNRAVPRKCWPSGTQWSRRCRGRSPSPLPSLTALLIIFSAKVGCVPPPYPCYLPAFPSTGVKGDPVVGRHLRKHLGHGGWGQEELSGRQSILKTAPGSTELIVRECILSQGWGMPLRGEEVWQMDQKGAVDHVQCLASVRGMHTAGQRSSALPSPIWLCLDLHRTQILCIKTQGSFLKGFW